MKEVPKEEKKKEPGIRYALVIFSLVSLGLFLYNVVSALVTTNMIWTILMFIMGLPFVMLLLVALIGTFMKKIWAPISYGLAILYNLLFLPVSIFILNIPAEFISDIVSSVIGLFVAYSVFNDYNQGRKNNYKISLGKTKINFGLVYIIAAAVLVLLLYATFTSVILALLM